MNDVNIILSCGNQTIYKNLMGLNDQISCPVCYTHAINVETCLEMAQNRLNMKQKYLELEEEKFQKCKKQLVKNKSDYESLYIEDRQSEIIKEIDLRKKELIILLNKQVYEYFNDLKIQVENEYSFKKKHFEYNLEKIESLEIRPNSDCTVNDLMLEQKIKTLDKDLFNMKENIDLVNKTISNVQEPSIEFIPGNFSKMKMENIFGIITIQEPSKFDLTNTIPNLALLNLDDSVDSDSIEHNFNLNEDEDSCDGYYFKNHVEDYQANYYDTDSYHNYDDDTDSNHNFDDDDDDDNDYPEETVSCEKYYNENNNEKLDEPREKYSFSPKNECEHYWNQNDYYYHNNQNQHYFDDDDDYYDDLPDYDDFFDQENYFECDFEQDYDLD